MIRDRLKWLMFPGINLHARQRFRTLPSLFGRPSNGETRNVLDAGCGNGMLSLASYLRGNRVLGVTVKEREVSGNRRLFSDFLEIPADELCFEYMNLYEVDTLERKFDEIICTEVLEHIVRDRDVCQSFFDILKPNGVLHLCCPNAEHPDNVQNPIDEQEGGGHVRSGYTIDGYKSILEPIGFQITEVKGLGGPIRQACNKRITRVRHKAGFPLGVLMFFLVWPLSLLDVGPYKIPYSLYVKAVKK